jgi:hypothetical protein
VRLSRPMADIPLLDDPDTFLPGFRASPCGTWNGLWEVAFQRVPPRII